jgi:hypothetical protein
MWKESKPGVFCVYTVRERKRGKKEEKEEKESETQTFSRHTQTLSHTKR